MPKKLYADGVTGKVAIYDPTVPAAFTDPLNNLGAVFFHSDLDYIGVVYDQTVTITHPSRGLGPLSSNGFRIPSFTVGQSAFEHNLGYQPYGLMFVDGYQVPANMQIQTSGQSFRTVSLYCTPTHAYIYDTGWVYNTVLPEITKTYRIVLFTQPIQPSGNKTIEIKPDSFVASRGKLNTAYNYLRRAVSSPIFWFGKGATAHAVGGSYRIVNPAGGVITMPGYTGGFTGTPGIGVEL